QSAKHVLRYRSGIRNLGIIYRSQKEHTGETRLIGFSDSDWAGDKETRKST
ncbi:hypothetical protein V1520DRAFT_283072, partial [Lipomyces starkeyi]